MTGCKPGFCRSCASLASRARKQAKRCPAASQASAGLALHSRAARVSKRNDVRLQARLLQVLRFTREPRAQASETMSGCKPSFCRSCTSLASRARKQAKRCPAASQASARLALHSRAARVSKRNIPPCNRPLRPFSQRAKGVTQHHTLPTEQRQREIETLGEVSSLVVGGKEIVGPRTRLEIRLVDVAGSARGAVLDQIGTQALWRTAEIVQAVAPGGVGPIIRRLFEGAGVGRNELGGNRTGNPGESQVPPLATAVVRAEGSIPHHVLQAIENLGTFVDRHTIGGDQDSGGPHP